MTLTERSASAVIRRTDDGRDITIPEAGPAVPARLGIAVGATAAATPGRRGITVGPAGVAATDVRGRRRPDRP